MINLPQKVFGYLLPFFQNNCQKFARVKKTDLSCLSKPFLAINNQFYYGCCRDRYRGVCFQLQDASSQVLQKKCTSSKYTCLYGEPFLTKARDTIEVPFETDAEVSSVRITFPNTHGQIAELLIYDESHKNSITTYSVNKECL